MSSKDYRARFPGIAVTLVEGGTSQLVDSLRAGRVDAAFIRSPSREVDGLFVVSILEEDMLIAVPSRHDLAASATLAREALSGQPFILFPRANSPEFYDNITLACRRAGFSPNIVQQAREVASALNLIAAGGGHLDRLCIDAAHAAARVAYRAILGDAPRAPLCPAHRNIIGRQRRCAISLRWRGAPPEISVETRSAGPVRVQQTSGGERNWPL